MEDHDARFERIACSVCGKTPGLSAEECYGTRGQRNRLCREYGHCRINEKTSEQYEYILFPKDQSVFLKACPGSGKTEVVGLKAALEIRDWSKSYCGIAVLTFTNNAADVINRRIVQFAGVDKLAHPHFVGTVDSWLHGYIANPFAHAVTGYAATSGDHSVRIVENSSVGGFLRNFQTLHAQAFKGNVLANHFYLEPDSNEVVFDSGERSLDIARNKLDLKPWQKQDLINTKNRFWKQGFATYQDIEYICHRLLSCLPEVLTRVAERFPLIIIDECQDLSETQLRFFRKLLGVGSSLHFVGDLDQAIYSFKKVDPRSTIAFTVENGFEKLWLLDNHRSYQPIVDIFGKIIGNQGIRGRRYNGSDPVCICFRYKSGEENELVRQFTKYLEKRGLPVEDCAILARGDSTVSRLRPGKSFGNPKDVRMAAMAIHLWQSQGLASMQEALECIGGFITNRFFRDSHFGSRYQYRPHSVSSAITWRFALSRILDRCLDDEDLSGLNTKWSDWIKALNHRLPQITYQSFPNIPTVVKLNLRSPVGLSHKSVIDTLGTVTQHANPGIRITTIHQAKGESLDAVMLVSSRTRSGNSGGHWKDWLDRTRDNGEHARFAFVASSRPRYLLAWAVPSPSLPDEQVIRDLGFTIVDC